MSTTIWWHTKKGSKKWSSLIHMLLETSFLDPHVTWNKFLHLQVFQFFSCIFSLMISTLTPLYFENRYYAISIYFASLSCILCSQNVVCLGKSSMWFQEECLFCCCWMKYSIVVYDIQLINHLTLTDFLYWIRSFLTEGC
jgi:hypothetical protein